MHSALIILFLCSLKTIIATQKPIVGILAQEIEPDDPYKDLGYTSYLPAAYVKAVEASGARVVPIFINREINYYKNISNKLNGFLYTGGSADILSHYGVARSGKIILDIVLEMNQRGDNVPILGVCQGMELLATLSNNGNPLLSDCNAENEALPLKFLPGYRESSLYKDATQDVLNTLSKLPSTSNHHGLCLTQKNLTRFNLKQWNVLSTSVSHDGFVFISSMEWKSHPIAAIQFHPEKLAYEWNPKQANPHDSKSIEAARLFYDWLVGQADLNNHAFPTVEEMQDDLIYNYCPIFTGKQDMYDEQVYYFKDPQGVLANAIPQDTSV